MDTSEELERLRNQVSHLMYLRKFDRGIQRMLNRNPQLAKHKSAFWTFYHEIYAFAMAVGLRRIIFPSRKAVCLVGFLDRVKKAKVPGTCNAHLVEESRALRSFAHKLQRYVNDHVAHISNSPTAELPTWAELDAILDRCGELVLKYSPILRNEAIADLEPLAPGDWKAIFRHAWIDK